MRRAAGPLAAAALAAALYLPGLRGEFIQDDKFAIEGDPRVTRISLREAFTTPYWWSVEPGLYRPLVRLSWSVDHAFAGLDPRFYRFGNLLLYAALACAATLLFQHLVGARAGFLAGLLFAVHPVHTEAVVQCVGRAELLAALGAVLALLCHRRGWTLATAAAYAVSLLSKETAAALPALLVVHDFALARRPVRDAVRRALPCVVVLAAFLGARWAVLGTPLRPAPGPHELATPHNELNRQFPLGHLGFVERLPVVVRILGLQLRLLVFAEPLRADWPIDALAEFPGLALSGLASLGLLVAGAVRLRGPMGLACAWIILAWLPISHLLLPIGTVFGERLLLFPSLPFALGLGVAIRRWPHVGAAAALALAVAGGVLTLRRIPDWRTERGLWEATVRTMPRSARAWFNAGRTRYEARDLDGAEEAFRQALAIVPRMEQAEMHLGLVAGDRGRLEEAEAHYLRALEWYPRYADAMFNLGRNHYLAGRRAEARRWIERALRENPGSELYRWGLREVTQ